MVMGQKYNHPINETISRRKKTMMQALVLESLREMQMLMMVGNIHLATDRI